MIGLFYFSMYIIFGLMPTYSYFNYYINNKYLKLLFFLSLFLTPFISLFISTTILFELTMYLICFNLVTFFPIMMFNNFELNFKKEDKLKFFDLIIIIGLGILFSLKYTKSIMEYAYSLF